MVRNAKAKVRRLKRKYDVDIGGEVPLPNLKDIETRKDFNKIKADIQQFNRRTTTIDKFTVTNERGVRASFKELRELEANTKKAQEIADAVRDKINELKFYTANSDKSLSTVGERLSRFMRPEYGVHRPRDFDFNNIGSESYLRTKMESMRERAQPDYFDERKVELKRNILLKMKKSFNSDGDDLVDRLIDISPDDLYELFLQHEEFQFDYRYTQEQLYSGNHDIVDEDVERLHAVLDRYYEGELNMDMKGFDR